MVRGIRRALGGRPSAARRRRAD